MKKRGYRKIKKTKIKRISIIMGVIFLILFCILIAMKIKKSNNDFSNSNTKEKSTVGEELYKDDTKAFEINTSYCELLYPEEWEEYLHTEKIVEDDREIVQFWAKFDQKENVHLFDIIFGGDGYEVGNLEIEDGKIISVNIESYNFESNDQYTEEQSNIIYNMMEDINYILFQLKEMDNFNSID